MRHHIWSDRRQHDRRSDAAALGGKRKEERRRFERREFVRLVYPHSVAPKALNANLIVANISQKGMQLICREHCRECACPLTLKSTADLRIQFHDGETINIEVEILRCARTRHSPSKTYAGFVKNGISSERIAKEQAFLLSHFPDFCRASAE